MDGATEPSLNEYSWNNVANMLYVDQPIGKWSHNAAEWENSCELTEMDRHRIFLRNRLGHLHHHGG